MKYKIKILSDWHVGSGLGAGAETDAEVLKNEKGLPYIPGKTIKGLLKDSLLEMPEEQANRKLIGELFGYEEKDEEGKVIRTTEGSLFFSNAYLPVKVQKEINAGLEEFLYRNISQTKIDKKGVTVNNSLRTMEVCMPVDLEGEIISYENGVEIELEGDEKDLILNALKWTRHLGVNRNRGLGRCQFVELKNEDE